MRSFRLCAVYGSSAVPLLPVASTVRPSSESNLTCHGGRSCYAPRIYKRQSSAVTATFPMLPATTSNSRWYATAHTSTPDATSVEATAAHPTTAFVRLSTAAEAAAELQRWIDSLATAEAPSSAASSPLMLSGKSLVLCVAALQLRKAQQTTATTTTAAASAASTTKPEQQYLTALARHVYTQYNAPGKPCAAWQLFEDVEKSVIHAEALRISLHYLQHHAFGNVLVPGKVGNNKATNGEQASPAKEPPAEYEARCAARDLELTFEAVEVLLVGWQISQIHREAALTEEVGSRSTTAAMVPPAEAAAFYIGVVTRLTRDPLSGCESIAQNPSASPSPFLTLPPSKQQFWTQAAQQLTTVLYLALLVTNANTSDAQLVSKVFRDTVRTVYGIPTSRFGAMRSIHYIVTVALPYVVCSFATLLDVLRAQQAQAAKKATASAKVNAQRTSSETKLTNVSQRKAEVTAFFSQKGSHAGGPKGGASTTNHKNNERTWNLSSDRMNKATVLLVFLATFIYMASWNR